MRKHALNHRAAKKLNPSIIATEVRWLSRGRVATRVELHEDINFKRATKTGSNALVELSLLGDNASTRVNDYECLKCKDQEVTLGKYVTF